MLSPITLGLTQRLSLLWTSIRYVHFGAEEFITNMDISRGYLHADFLYVDSGSHSYIFGMASPRSNSLARVRRRRSSPKQQIRLHADLVDKFPA